MASRAFPVLPDAQLIGGSEAARVPAHSHSDHLNACWLRNKNPHHEGSSWAQSADQLQFSCGESKPREQGQGKQSQPELCGSKGKQDPDGQGCS